MDSTQLKTYIEELVSPAQKVAGLEKTKASYYIGMAVVLAEKNSSFIDELLTKTNNVLFRIIDKPGDDHIDLGGNSYKKYASYEEAMMDSRLIIPGVTATSPAIPEVLISLTPDKRLSHGITIEAVTEIIDKYNLTQYDK